MIRRAILAIVFLLAATSAARAGSPVALTECGTITQPGNYIFENELVLPILNPNFYGTGGGGDCLIVSASHVHIDMGGLSVTIVCPTLPTGPNCSGYLLPQGDIGIHVMQGADHVSISNGNVEGFEYGMVVEADHASVNNLSSSPAIYGTTLKNASFGNFTNIYSSGAIPGLILPEYYLFGYVASINGGGHNTFTSLGGFNLSGLLFTNSSYNIVNMAQLDVLGSFFPEPSIGISLTQSSNHNSITNSELFAQLGNGIEINGSGYNFVDENSVTTLSPPPFWDILLTQGSNRNEVTNNNVGGAGVEFFGGIAIDLDSGYNFVGGNDVTTMTPTELGYFQLFDGNPQCDHDVWLDNIFSSANPSNCIN